MASVAAEITRKLRAVAVVSMIGGVVVAALPARSQIPGAPAQVVDYEPPLRVEKYKVTDFGKSASAKDDVTSKAKFRVAERTGNCCENYLTATPDGTIYDLGGSYINFTSDDGKTWKSVRPLNPLVNGEGTLAVAPNGDIVGVEWDPYSGDHLLSYKYDAASKQWLYLEAPLHTAFYDRPWLTVVPGPFTINGAKVPYVSYVDGFPHSGTLLYSTDGLSYYQTSDPSLDQQTDSEKVRKLPIKPGAQNDWIQPNSQSPIIPLGGGSALAPPGLFSNAPSVLNPDTMKWQAVELDTGGITGRILVDSKGRLHNVLATGEQVTYRTSLDGGRTWKTADAMLPTGVRAMGGMTVDFRANAKVGIAAIGLHVDRGATDGDIMFKVDITSNQPRFLKRYEIGKGDIDASSGVGQDIRFDFETLAILPDGRVAVSFLDSTTGPVYSLTSTVQDRLGPALAIEL